MSHLVSTILSGVWPFVVTNIDDFVVLTALFVTVHHGGLTPAGIVLGQYLGMGTLVAVSVIAATGPAPATPPADLRADHRVTAWSGVGRVVGARARR